MVNRRISCGERETVVDAKPMSAAKSAIVGPDGYLMSIRDLPPADTTRWVARRKAIVVFAVAGGLISAVEACKRYGLTLEELEGWKGLVQIHGVRGLRVTRAKYYRALGQSR